MHFQIMCFLEYDETKSGLQILKVFGKTCRSTYVVLKKTKSGLYNLKITFESGFV